MQKISSADRIKLLRHWYYLERKSKRTSRKYNPNRNIVQLDRNNKTEKSRYIGQKIALPSIFSFEHNITEATIGLKKVKRFLGLEFVPKSRPKSSHYRTPTSLPKTIVNFLDFSKINYIGHDVALVIAALYHETNNYNQLSNIFTVDRHKWSPSVVSTLEIVGFFKFFGISSPTELKENKYSSLEISPGQSKNVDHVHITKQLCAICQHQIQNDQKVYIETVISELLKNIRQYAYLGIRENNDPDWWFAASFDKENGVLRFSIYDVGFSIPYTLPFSKHYQLPKDDLIAYKNEVWRELLKLTPYSNDGEQLGIALTTHASSTLLPNRGNGLIFMTELLNELPGMSLRVISRAGVFEKSWNKPHVINQLNYPVRGTLISLRLEL